MKTIFSQITPRIFICGFNAAGYAFTGMATARHRTVKYSIQVREISIANNAKSTIRN